MDSVFPIVINYLSVIELSSIWEGIRQSVYPLMCTSYNIWWVNFEKKTRYFSAKLRFWKKNFDFYNTSCLVGEANGSQLKIRSKITFLMKLKVLSNPRKREQ